MKKVTKDVNIRFVGTDKKIINWAIECLKVSISNLQREWGQYPENKDKYIKAEITSIKEVF